MKKQRLIEINDDKKLLLVIVLTIVILGIITIQVSAMSNTDSYNRKLCPYTIKGNINATLNVKYFDSPYCFYCWMEQPILKRALEEKGHLFNIKKYDIRYCLEEKKKYNMPGTPGWVFINKDQEFPTYGFIKEVNLNKIICELSGGC
jgi:hypothetical protein